MLTSDFDYDLPRELIAQHPADPRDSSRLLVYDRAVGRAEHRKFCDVGDYLRPGDVLALNETKVIPARLFGVKRGADARLELLLLKKLSLGRWEAIMKPGKKLKPGQYVDFGEGFCAKLVQKKEDGVCEVRFEYEGVFENLLERYGRMPTPPYITQTLDRNEQYQTVYAKTEGSAAAPTAGLHFTDALMDTLKGKGVILAKLLLHVGLGTFRPMKEARVEDHIMHTEYCEISEESAHIVNLAKKEGRRVIAVGTTSVRTLESAAGEDGTVRAARGETGIFIYPGYRFRVVDALLTNFHLPKSTLLMLVSAFAGRENMLGLYQTAVKMRYRFFSFGDATLIL